MFCNSSLQTSIMVNKIQVPRFFVYCILIDLVFFSQFNCYAMGEIERKSSEQIITPSVVNIGVIQNLSSPFGSMISLCIEIANSDFYSAHPNYKTRLGLRSKDVQDVLDADLAVRELLEHEQVHGILGNHGQAQDTFVAQLGRKAKVPIISFTDRSTADLSLISSENNRYFIQTAPDDAVQARALAAVVSHGFKWKKVVVLYEDTKYGLQFLSHLNRAFQDVKIGLARLVPIPAPANDTHVHNELRNLNENQTVKVFLVHMNPSLGSRLFFLAKEIGMMCKEHAWIITDSLSNFLNSMDTPTRDSMEGVVGVRPYVPPSTSLDNFRQKWKINSANRKTVPEIMDLNVYGLWAYDTVIALAIAVETIGPLNSTSLYAKLSNTSIKGLSGDFELVNGIRKPSAFEIINVLGTGERRLGFWTPEQGITRDLNSSTEGLKNVVWPGDSVTRPKGWSIPPTGPLMVGVPGKPGFKEFVNISEIIDPATKEAHATGFAIDIFLAASKVLPFPIEYKFICYNCTTDDDTDWTYDDMVHEIRAKGFDMIVGDTTILASRAEYVDFSLPYAESVVVLLVNNAKALDMWTFTKPLRWDLWLAILVSCIFMGIVIWILERQITNPANDERSGMIYLTPIAVLAFHERNMVSNKWSLFLLVCWLFMAFILMQSFSANLSAILTVDQLINAPPSHYRYIGYQKGSFIQKYLTEKLNFSESNLKSFSSPEEFHEAMSSGGIEAVVDEIPYMKFLVNRYGSKYRIVRQLKRTEGLGFAFPVGSPLAAYFSRAILNVTQGPEMTFIEQKNFGPGYSSQDPLSSTLSQGTSSLSFHHFAGLFIIVGLATFFAVVCSERAIILSALSDITRQLFHINIVDGDHVENAKDANRDEQDNIGEQGEGQGQGPRRDRDDEEIVEESLSKEADDVQDVGEAEMVVSR